MEASRPFSDLHRGYENFTHANAAVQASRDRAIVNSECRRSPKLPLDISSSRHYTPSPSITKDLFGDRFIPCRATANLYAKFMAADEAAKPDVKSSVRAGVDDPTTTAADTQSNSKTKEEGQFANYSHLLQSQLLDDGSDTENVCWNMGRPCENNDSVPGQKKLLRFKRRSRKTMPAAGGVPPLGLDAGKLLPPGMIESPPRAVAKAPFKVLDAPQLRDDYYLNLVDWSSQNILSVGLGAAVYVWSACTSKVTRLCDVGPEGDSITSVAWSERGTHLAVGLNSSETQIWDLQQLKVVRTLGGHTGRVSVAAWNDALLSTGSRDRLIVQHDVRAGQDVCHKLLGHKQEVCGLKWSFNGQQLASGGNDNKLFLWSVQATTPLAKFADHQAAVKAIAWSPHQHGLLASGGGTADRCIKFWNTLTCDCVKSIDTGSQVCNLMFSRSGNELVSTHGYSLNQILVWNYPHMAKLATLTGHTYRVLYLGMSPDGESIVTGAGDETLRFWNIFPPLQSRAVNVFQCSSGLIPDRMDIR